MTASFFSFLMPWLLVCVSCLSTFGCNRTGYWSECGNDRLDTGEECDGADLGGQTCVGLSYTGGTLACTESCAFDTSGCTGSNSCGDGVLDAGEECDGSDLGGMTCETLGYTAGSLSCTPSCTFDVSACTTCGNGIVEPGEECDGANLDGQSCEGLGYPGGSLICSDACRFDMSGCGRCPPPVESCADRGGSFWGCEEVWRIGRVRAAGAEGYTARQVTCSAGSVLDEDGCADAGQEQVYSIYLLVDETIRIDATRLSGCGGDPAWNMTFKVYQNPGCVDTSCAELALCNAGVSHHSGDFIAPHDGWYFLAVDGVSDSTSDPDAGTYDLEVHLTCNNPGCDC